MAHDAGTVLAETRAGRCDVLPEWLDDGHDPDVSDDADWTPLLITAARVHRTLVDLLLRHKRPCARRANLDRRFPCAWALPIYMAGQSGDGATAALLLITSPHDIFDVALAKGHTILLQTAFFGQRSHVASGRYLLESVPAILSLDAGDAFFIRVAMLRLLTATNVRGQSALARTYNIKAMVELLEALGRPEDVSVERYYRQVLMTIAPRPPTSDERAAQQGTECQIAAIPAGLDNARKSLPGPARSVAREDVVSTIGKLLRQFGLDINRRAAPLQRAPLIIACIGTDSHEDVTLARDAIVKSLLEAGAEPLVREGHAMSIDAINRAAVWRHLRLLKRFVAVVPGPRFVEARNERRTVNKFTALHDSVVRALTADGSLFERYLGQITWLVEAGSRPDSEDHSSRSPAAIVDQSIEDASQSECARRIRRVIDREKSAPASTTPCPWMTVPRRLMRPRPRGRGGEGSAVQVRNRGRTKAGTSRIHCM